MRVLIENYTGHKPFREIILRSSFNGVYMKSFGTALVYFA